MDFFQGPVPPLTGSSSKLAQKTKLWLIINLNPGQQRYWTLKNKNKKNNARTQSMAMGTHKCDICGKTISPLAWSLLWHNPRLAQSTVLYPSFSLSLWITLPNWNLFNWDPSLSCFVFSKWIMTRSSETTTSDIGTLSVRHWPKMLSLSQLL